MALKKSQLYKSLWQSCDELRGGTTLAAPKFKDDESLLNSPLQVRFSE